LSEQPKPLRPFERSRAFARGRRLFDDVTVRHAPRVPRTLSSAKPRVDARAHANLDARTAMAHARDARLEPRHALDEVLDEGRVVVEEVEARRVTGVALREQTRERDELVPRPTPPRLDAQSS